MRRAIWTLAALIVAVVGCKAPPPTSAGAIAKEPTRLYWGDTHVHLSDSPDAQIDVPLDFVVVADPAETDGVKAVSWSETIEAVDQDYEPCTFTSFIGWEWTSTLDGNNLHRVVFMNGGAEQALQFTPFGAFDGPRPEDLWAWLEETSQRVGTDFIAISHDSNINGDMMYDEADSDGRPITAEYARMRMRWEPVMSGKGLTAVWAEENTRTSIFAAFKRKEVYATTGPRIRVRFFGGWGFKSKNAKGAGLVKTGYALGRPMGSDLTKRPEGKAPGFLMYAVKDPKGDDLDRVQIIKGWVDADGHTHEKTYDVVWSKDGARDEDGPVPAVTGAPALSGFWSDPDFDPGARAFYYMRVLQIPTGDTGRPPTIQERADTSPIWYTP